MELSKGFGTSGSGLNWELVLDWERTENESGRVDIDVSSYGLQNYELLLLKTYNIHNGNPTGSSTQNVSLSLTCTYKSGYAYNQPHSVSFGSLSVGGVDDSRFSLSSEAMCMFCINADDGQIKGFSAINSVNVIRESGAAPYYDGAPHKAKIASVDTLSLIQENPGTEPTMKILPGAKIQIYGLK